MARHDPIKLYQNMLPKDTVPIDVGRGDDLEEVRAPYCLACGRRPQEYHMERVCVTQVRVWHGLCLDCDDRSSLEVAALVLERMARERIKRAEPGYYRSFMPTELQAEAARLREADRD